MSAVRVDLEHPSDISGKAIYVSETRTTENDAAIYLFDEANEEDSSKSLQFNAISKLQDYRCRYILQKNPQIFPFFRFSEENKRKFQNCLCSFSER